MYTKPWFFNVIIVYRVVLWYWIPITQGIEEASREEVQRKTTEIMKLQQELDRMQVGIYYTTTSIY